MLGCIRPLKKDWRYMDIIINMKWDSESSVWVAVNDEIGLVLESGSYDALVERVRYAAPEIMELNNIAGCNEIKFV